MAVQSEEQLTMKRLSRDTTTCRTTCECPLYVRRHTRLSMCHSRTVLSSLPVTNCAELAGTSAAQVTGPVWSAKVCTSRPGVFL